MHRRDFLLTSSIGALTLPGWFRMAFGGAPQEPEVESQERRRRRLLRGAARRARDWGKPLLVLVVPKAERDVSRRESEFARWLVSSKAEHQLDMGLFVLACATVADVTAVLGLKTETAEPQMIALDVSAFESEDAVAPLHWPIHVELEELSSFRDREIHGRLAPDETEESFLAAQTATLAASLRKQLESRGLQVEELAAAVEQKLSAAERQVLVAWLKGDDRPKQQLLHRATAYLREAFNTMEPSLQARLRTELAAAIQADLFGARIAGSAWAMTEGCGHTILDPEKGDHFNRRMIECGMGFLPKESQRFLLFLVDPK